MNLVFKPLKEAHLEKVGDLFKNSFPDLPFEDLGISWASRSHGDSMGFWHGSKLIGFAIMSYHKSSRNSMYIDYFALDKEVRGNGLGTQILKAFLKELQGSVHLYPLNDEIASWYKRNGFKQSCKGYYVYHTYNLRK